VVQALVHASNKHPPEEDPQPIQPQEKPRKARLLGMEPTGFEPVTSCLQTVVTVIRRSDHLQHFWAFTSSYQSTLVYRNLLIVFGRFGRRHWLAAFLGGGRPVASTGCPSPRA